MSGSTAKNETRRAAEAHAAPLKLEEFLPYRLNVVASLVSQALSRIYVDRYGIGVPEWRILVTLGEFETMYSTDLQKPPGANFWEWIKTAQFKV